METKNVSIIGLDRISASVGIALREADMGLTIIGQAENKGEAQLAKEVGAVDEITGSISKAARSADIIILNKASAEHEAAIELIGEEIREHTLVVDLSRLKSAGLEHAREHVKTGHYIGAAAVFAAPWLLDGRMGIEAAHGDMFEHSIFCLMPAAEADPKAVETAVNLGRILGATPYFLDPMEYDSLVQGVETLPGLLGAAIFRAVSQSTAWRDLLRFAGLDFSLSTVSVENTDIPQLALQDKNATLRWLDSTMSELEKIRRLIVEGDPERLSLVLEDVEIDRQRWLEERKRNAWTEDVSAPELGSISLGAQLFGFRRGSGDKDE